MQPLDQSCFIKDSQLYCKPDYERSVYSILWWSGGAVDPPCVCVCLCVCVFVRLLSNEMTFNPPDIRDMLVYLYPFKVTLVGQDHGSVFTARVG